VFRNYAVAIALASLAGAAVAVEDSAPTKKQPIDINVVSMPPVPPSPAAEVKITSMPAASPAKVEIVSAPPDESAHNLVKATWGLLGATVVLAIATFLTSWWQSRDTKRRDKSAMLREVRRNANKVMVQATRLKQVALLIPGARNHLSVLLHQGGTPPTVKVEIENDLKQRTERLDQMINGALDIVSGDLPRKSDGELTGHLWRLDSHEVQLDMLREAITDELSRYESESLTIREHNAAMQAAALGAKLAAREGSLG
jgi:hypothetical protein